uniref:Uncharacterized protein n=1 Tax=Zea mays TaxID=4577 RepID=A0A804N583_MAIZE
MLVGALRRRGRHGGGGPDGGGGGGGGGRQSRRGRGRGARLPDHHGGQARAARPPLLLLHQLRRERVQLLPVRLLRHPPPPEQLRLHVPLRQHAVRRRCRLLRVQRPQRLSPGARRLDGSIGGPAPAERGMTLIIHGTDGVWLAVQSQKNSRDTTTHLDANVVAPARVPERHGHRLVDLHKAGAPVSAFYYHEYEIKTKINFDGSRVWCTDESIRGGGAPERGLVLTMSATPSAVRRTISAGDGERGGMGVRQPAEGAAPAEHPEPMETTRRSSTPAASGNSCLLWSTCVMAAAVGLPMAATPPDAAAMAVRPSTDRTAAAAPPPAQVAAHTSRSRKSKLSLSTASAREKRKGAAVARS